MLESKPQDLAILLGSSKIMSILKIDRFFFVEDVVQRRLMLNRIGKKTLEHILADIIRYPSLLFLETISTS